MKTVMRDFAGALAGGVERGGAVYGEWCDGAAAEVCRGEWSGWPPEAGWEVLRGAFQAARAEEGCLWLVDDLAGVLRPVFHSGPGAEMFVREIRQPLNAGLVSMVFSTGNGILEESVAERPEYCPDVDRRLGKRTRSMVAVPVVFAGRCRGVLSGVVFDSAGAGSLAGDAFERMSVGAAEWGEWMNVRLEEAWRAGEGD
jgi:hypothetical protein